MRWCGFGVGCRLKGFGLVFEQKGAVGEGLQWLVDGRAWVGDDAVAGFDEADGLVELVLFGCVCHFGASFCLLIFGGALCRAETVFAVKADFAVPAVGMVAVVERGKFAPQGAISANMARMRAVWRMLTGRVKTMRYSAQSPLRLPNVRLPSNKTEPSHLNSPSRSIIWISPSRKMGKRARMAYGVPFRAWISAKPAMRLRRASSVSAKSQPSSVPMLLAKA